MKCGNSTFHHLILLMQVIAHVVLLQATSLGQAAGTNIDFSSKIRPILSENCFRCHGPDDQAREADLRLDVRQGLLSAPSGVPIVVAGDASASELVQRIQSDDPDVVMPPPDSNKSLSSDEKILLEQWITQGADWEQHWSFVPLVRPDVPKPIHPGFVRDDIDCFVQSRLDEVGLQPSTFADPYVLVRRLYLDLTGLLPTPEESDAWVAKIWLDDSKPDQIHEEAYQELVSELLDSPHYGERWAKPWLDLARYADTNGYEKDRDRTIWPYRDWVVQALNQDMPFDQFTIEQLAGDMLPDATQDQIVATGFHRNTMLNEEGGIDPLEFRFHAMTDRVATTGTTWLGLTLGCCQCHTHKYDPISHREYYQFMALMNNADEPILELPESDFASEWNKNKAEAKELKKQLASRWPIERNEDKEIKEGKGPTEDGENRTGETELQDLRESEIEKRFKDWLTKERKNLVHWRIMDPIEATSNLPILTIEGEGKVFASGDTAKRDEYRIRFANQDQAIQAIQLEALPDERLPARGPGTTYYEGTIGDFYLTELRVFADEKPVKVVSASETYAKNRYGKNPVSAQLTIDGDVQTGWSVHGRQGERHVAVYLLEQPIPKQSVVRVEMVFGRHFASSLGLFRFSSTSANNLPQARDYTAETIHLLQKKASVLAADEKSKLRNEFLIRAKELEKQAEKIRKLEARPSVTTTLVLQERKQGHERPTFRHHRGEYLQPEEQVQPDTPSVLPRLDVSNRDRLGLANWLVDENNPLTSRVVVNRAWASFFGTGLVKTLDDFGLQGDYPSHPKLLDWLALQLIEDRWSLKSLHRRIVSSHTYRQSSYRGEVSSDSVDPENRLLSRFPRTRLEAEILRDAMLVVSGKLVRKMGGPPVKPPQPKGVTELAYGSPKWDESKGEDRYRRSLYTYMKRTAPFAMYNTFDAPSGESCVARRNRSNSPLQALTLLNDRMVLELASYAGIRFSELDARASVEHLFRSALTRKPSEYEREQLLKFLRDQEAAFQTDLKAAKLLLGAHQKSPSKSEKEKSDLQITQGSDKIAYQAAWVALARVIFSLDEFQTRN